MRSIGLVRHFRVVVRRPKRAWLTAEQFNAWMDLYDYADIEPVDFDPNGQEWDQCISSDLPRAAATAGGIFPGTVRYTDKLREIKFAAVNLPGVRLHYNLWLLLGRLAWYFGHRSQPEGRQATEQRAREVADLLQAEYSAANVLTVTHGAFMQVLVKELRTRGYTGSRILHPRNGKLYVFQFEGD